jgi:hypothetical protein
MVKRRFSISQSFGSDESLLPADSLPPKQRRLQDELDDGIGVQPE